MKNKVFAAIGKQLVNIFPGFTLKSPLFFMYPVQHTLRGLCFESSEFGREQFYVWVFFQPLFVPSDYIYFTHGFRLRKHDERELWDIRQLDLVLDLENAIRNKALPFLSRIETPRDVAIASFKAYSADNPNIQQAIAYAYAREGDVNQAIVNLDRLLACLDPAVPWQVAMAEPAQLLRKQLLTDPSSAQRQLERWECETAHHLGIEEYRKT